MLFKRATIGAKIETNYGVEVAVAAGDLFLAEATTPAPEADKIERLLDGATISTRQHLLSRHRQTITFIAELKGTGSKIAALLQSCAMKKTGDKYEPTTESQKSCTIYAYIDGLLHKIVGAMGTWEIALEAGEIGKISFTFTGLYKRPSDASLVAGTAYDSNMPPIVKSSGFKIGAYAGIVQALNLAINNTVSLRPNVSASWGIEGVLITERAANGSINPEAVIEATHTFWKDWEEAKANTLEITVGETTGNKYKITAPKVVADSLGYGDREGIRIYEKAFSCHQSSGDDEVVIEFI